MIIFIEVWLIRLSGILYKKQEIFSLKYAETWIRCLYATVYLLLPQLTWTASV